jgi:CheY-like chemotaxis protein
LQYVDSHYVKENTPFSLRFVLEESLDIVSFQACSKSIELVCDTDDPLLPEHFLGDPGRIRQILVNLLNNAIKFSDKSGSTVTVTVGCNKTEGDRCNVAVSVRDFGIGITDEAQQHLFLPFVQADTSVSRRYGGTGLGLAICSQLATLMGGKMWADSQPGKGSTFSFSVNLQLKLPLQTETHFPLEFANKQLLLIEPCEALSKMLHCKLSRWGFSVTSSGSYQETEGRLNKGTFDIILADESELQRLLDSFPHLCQNIVAMACCVSKFENFPKGLTGIKKPIKNKSLMETLASNLQRTSPVEVGSNSNSKPEPVKSTPVKHLRILIVEDNVINQKVLGIMSIVLNLQVIVKLLAKLGYLDIEVAENGKKALVSLSARPVDLIFMDLMVI